MGIGHRTGSSVDEVTAERIGTRPRTIRGCAALFLRCIRSVSGDNVLISLVSAEPLFEPSSPLPLTHCLPALEVAVIFPLYAGHCRRISPPMQEDHMRLVLGGLQIYRPRSRRQDVLTLRHGGPQGNRVCRECHNDFRSMGGVRRFQATLCPGCIGERLERLSADAL